MTQPLPSPTAPAAASARWRMVLLALGAIVIITVHDFRTTGIVGESTYVSMTAGAAVVAWIGAGRHLGRLRRAWLAIAFGLAASAVGDIGYAFYDVVLHQYPTVSPCDIGWITSYVALAYGLIALGNVGRRRDGIDVDSVIDMVAIGTIGLLIVWQFSLAATVSDSSLAVLNRVVLASYPILDAALFVLVTRAVVNLRAWPRSAWLLGAGLMCWLVSDFWYMAQPDPGGLIFVLDTGWMIGALMMGVAASTTSNNDSSSETALNEVGTARVVIALAPLIAPGAVDLIAHWRGDVVNPLLLAVSTVIVVSLAFVRALRLLRATERARAALESSERHYRTLAINSSDASIVLDADGRVRSDSPNLAALLGVAVGTTRGLEALRFIAPEDVDAALAVFERSLLAPGVVFETEVRVRRVGGGERWFAARLVNLVDDADVEGVVVNLHDVTDRKHMEEELAHQAFHDALTGLPNRALFRDRLEHALERNARTGSDPAVIYLDVDGFKNVNDTQGHDMGDLLLRTVAQRVLTCVRSGDTTARLGGDEFAVLIEQATHPLDEARAVADRVLEGLREPIRIGATTVTVSVSLGIAVGDGETSATALLRNADIAMYRAKTTGKARWVLYDPEMREAALERAQLETDLAGAVEAGQFRVLYQPVVELAHDRVTGFEALLRWHHPTLGVVSPDKFVPIAESTGDIAPIGWWVLETACATAAQWQREFPMSPPRSIAVNVSARQLTAADALDHVKAALRHSGLAASSLVLEMTESALIEDCTLAAERLHELRAIGVQIAIDDFGTGYSSLSYLRQFPIDILKIDRSFISTIVERDDAPVIVRGLLELGHTLGLVTVAEGIESALQHEQLRDQQCEFGQGFLFAPPLAVEDAEALLAALGPSGAIGHSAPVATAG